MTPIPFGSVRTQGEQKVEFLFLLVKIYTSSIKHTTETTLLNTVKHETKYQNLVY